MYSFKFSNISQLTNNEQLEKGCYLCVWHANKIPPHIGLLINGAYYSLKVKGKDTGIPLVEIMKVIKRKSIPTVFAEVKLCVEKEIIESIFSTFGKAEASKFTCLTPITQIFNQPKNVNMLADLLNSFQSKNQLGKIIGLNLDSNFEGILSYGKKEIEERLIKLNKTL